MNIYEWRSDVEARWLTTRRESDRDFLELEGQSLGTNWRPLEVEWILDGRADHKRPITDCPVFVAGVPVLSAQAIEALKPQLEAAGELLPLTHETHRYFVFNVTNVVDALDEERSELMRFGSSGRIMLVKAFAFHEDRLGRHCVFKDHRLVRNTVFATEAFVNAVADARLSGFRFGKVWPAAE
ncbi:MAG: imm11 family protein [Burkholderiales bacterium]